MAQTRRFGGRQQAVGRAKRATTTCLTMQQALWSATRYVRTNHLSAKGRNPLGRYPNRVPMATWWSSRVTLPRGARSKGYAIVIDQPSRRIACFDLNGPAAITIIDHAKHIHDQRQGIAVWPDDDIVAVHIIGIAIRPCD